MEIHINALVYSEKGKQLFPRLGTILAKGSLVKDGDTFRALENDFIVCNGAKDFISDISDRKKMTHFSLKPFDK